MARTVPMGQLLLNSVLPSSHQIAGKTSKKDLKKLLIDLARTDPEEYVRAVSDLKRVGDEVTTDTGITVGLDDIEPDYARRDKILEPALERIRKTKDKSERVRLINDTQKQLMEVTKYHPGQMTMMATSGARGKLAQLMRTVGSPVAVVDDKNKTIPWMISKSFAEGLKAPDVWAEMTESRRNVVESNLAVSEPGEVGKLLVNTMSDQLVTLPDCGTSNGVLMDPSDPNIHDRYIANTNELITPQVADRLRHDGRPVVVRSPMTCEAPHGVCQRCQGLDEKGQVHTVGTNVGMRAAQALSEPLTQMALNAKHAVRTTGSKNTVLQGLSGFRQLTDIPQSFFNKATLTSREGKVTDIKAAPQGGHYVHVEDQPYYVPPALQVAVKPGARVEPGDRLSTGIPKPDEVVKYKGLGAGRRYLVDSLYDVYSGSGVDVDKRHLELLAKTDLNRVRIMDEDSGDLDVMRGDVVDYNRFRASIAAQSKMMKVSDAIGSTLGDSVLHHTAGTRITASLARDLQRHGITQVPVAPRVPKHEMIMKPIARTPLMNADVLARLAHRNLKQTLLEGAAFGDRSDLHGTNPIPAFVFGAEFGTGPSGRY
jgi:DNA-directed RNA polymerase subunit beta'